MSRHSKEELHPFEAAQVEDHVTAPATVLSDKEAGAQ